MMTRYWDRRQFIRVPASGLVRWTSGARCGHGQLVDISPGGAGLRMPVRRAAQLGPLVTLELEASSSGTSWTFPKEARVVRTVPDHDGQCLVGLEFPADQQGR